MFFDDISQIEEISSRVGCAIFVLPKETEVKIKNAYILQPEEKTIITIEQIKDAISSFKTKQITAQFILIRPAEKMGEEAANAILKSLEEPGENLHFVLVTDSLSELLPTIRSRAAVYFWRGEANSISEIKADEKIKEVAKRLLIAKPQDLVGLAEEITKKKEGVRAYALTILSVAVEMAYKSYLITGKKPFLDKIPKLIAAYDNIKKNGHIKLRLVADLI